ncbi:MAG TPA: GGDEF domain-containing protein [Thermoanaerobaculia bacterium]|nr:GGDEF domain-containing protein [Thermoanaerobaculia bacterium]
MELLLWRWSTAAQVTSVLIVTIFFVVLSRSVGRADVRPWVYAWLANLGAMVITILFWFLQPQDLFNFALRTGYFVTKTAFIVLLLRGAANFTSARFGRRHRLPIALGIAGYSLLAGWFSDSVDRIGIVQSSLIAIFLAAGACVLARTRSHGLGWLAAGFATRSALAFAEAAAYALRAQGAPGSISSRLSIFLASHSSFDTAAEWLIALGCVLAIHQRIQLELRKSNAELLAAQEVLQQLADRDPLTGLANRRALPEVFRNVEREATILFFDFDGFKQINDVYGHQVGDECLRRFASALLARFGKEGAVVRYGGDEFLVVVEELPELTIVSRIDNLRAFLQKRSDDAPPIAFSVGRTSIAAGDDIEAALRDADDAMYRDKTSNRPRARARA